MIRTNRLIALLKSEGVVANLREQIETAWKNRTHRGWMSADTLKNCQNAFSDNTVAFGTLWEVTIHYNNCKAGCNLRCALGAGNLVKSRLESMKRGMPDLHPDEDSAIWELAFLNHARFCENGAKYSGSIKPTWSDPKDGLDGVCNCFEVAKMRYDQQASKTTTVPIARNVVIGPEDVWYDEQRME